MKGHPFFFLLLFWEIKLHVYAPSRMPSRKDTCQHSCFSRSLRFTTVILSIANMLWRRLMLSESTKRICLSVLVECPCGKRGVERRKTYALVPQRKCTSWHSLWKASALKECTEVSVAINWGSWSGSQGKKVLAPCSRRSWPHTLLHSCK